MRLKKCYRDSQLLHVIGWLVGCLVAWLLGWSVCWLDLVQIVACMSITAGRCSESSQHPKGRQDKLYTCMYFSQRPCMLSALEDVRAW